MMIELRRIENLAGGDRSFVQLVLQKFLAASPDYIVQIQKAIDERNTDNLYFMSHKYKSAAGVAGAMKLCDVLMELEGLSQGDDWKEISLHMEKIRDTSNQTNDSAQKILTTMFNE